MQNFQDRFFSHEAISREAIAAGGSPVILAPAAILEKLTEMSRIHKRDEEVFPARIRLFEEISDSLDVLIRECGGSSESNQAIFNSAAEQLGSILYCRSAKSLGKNDAREFGNYGIRDSDSERAELKKAPSAPF